jgi:hypothetical protein
MSLLLLAIIGGGAIAIEEEIRRSRPPAPPSLAGSRVEDRSRPTAGAGRITGYVGAATCRECHPGESALYARSAHRRTLRRATPDQSPVVAWLAGKMWKDPEVADVTWSYQVKDGRLVAQRASDGRNESLPLDFGVGSGVHGVTFVAVQAGARPGMEPTGIEHRISYLAHGPSIAITPGQENRRAGRLEPHDVPWGRTLGSDGLQECFKCHATLTSTLASTRLDLSSLIPNVTCESCHGPGRDHVEAARRGQDELTMPMGYDRPEPWVEVNLCGGCHKLPPDLAGDQLSPDNNELARLQGVGISLSPCYAQGRSGLRCVACHDPHDRVSHDRTRYEAACLACHGTASKRDSKPGECPVSPQSGCIGCHMPRREVSGKAWFTDHWIRKPARSTGPGGDRSPAASASAIRPSVPEGDPRPDSNHPRSPDLPDLRSSLAPIHTPGL